MDAFAAAICEGVGIRRRLWRQALLIALSFGLFQALMPLAGYLIGDVFNEVAQEYDHWIAFLLLSLVGAKMIKDSFEPESEPCESCSHSGKGLSASQKRDVLRVFALSVATSIDALVVGFTFAFIQIKLSVALIMIGVVTALLSLSGVFIGHRFGSKYKNKAELLGGVILMFLGFKIMLEHTELLAQLL